MTENELSYLIVKAAIEVHKTLGGPGLLESVYEEALAWELSENGLSVKRQEPLPINYKVRWTPITGPVVKIENPIQKEEVKDAEATEDSHGRVQGQGGDSGRKRSRDGEPVGVDAWSSSDADPPVEEAVVGWRRGSVQRGRGSETVAGGGAVFDGRTVRADRAAENGTGVAQKKS